MPSPQWLLLVPLAVALGLDLYLALLVLAALARLPAVELPGAMGALGSPWIALAAAALYLAGWLVERRRVQALAWECFNLPLRPVAAALLVLLVMPPPPGTFRWELLPAGAMVVAFAAAGTVQLLRVGWGLLGVRGPGRRPGPVLRILSEDLLVVALLVGAFSWSPAATAALTLLLGLALVPAAPSLLRAARFVPRLLAGKVRSLAGASDWTPFARLPGWVRRRLSSDEGSPVRGIRGVRGAVVGASDAGLLRDGWFVLGPSGPTFLHRAWRRIGEVRRFGSRPLDVRAHDEVLRVDWPDRDGRLALLLPRGVAEEEFREAGPDGPPG